MGSPSSYRNIKALRFVITLADQSAPPLVLEGLRASVYIDHAGAAMIGALTAEIYGMTESQMFSLTNPQWRAATLSASGNVAINSLNLIQVFAIDGTQETLIYNGQILNSWGDFQGMPQAYLHIDALVNVDALVNPAQPLSVASNTTVATVMAQIASQMGFAFENNGVNITIPEGDYYGNTLMEQVRTLQENYGFWMYIDGSRSTPTLAIAPQGIARNVAAPLISSQTGMIGYPIFNTMGMNFETLFNPALTLGGPVQVDSSIPLANGTWIVVSMSHQLTSQMPGGPWKTCANAVWAGQSGITVMP